MFFDLIFKWDGMVLGSTIVTGSLGTSHRLRKKHDAPRINHAKFPLHDGSSGFVFPFVLFFVSFFSCTCMSLYPSLQFLVRFVAHIRLFSRMQ